MTGPRRARAGLTLVELLIVVVVLTGLAAVILPKFLGTGQRGREAALKGNLRVLRHAISRFQADTSLYPDGLKDLADTSAPAKGRDSEGKNRAIVASDWNGPYIESVPTDSVSGAKFKYYDKPDEGHRVGEVRSSATGNALDGTPYRSW